MDECHNNKVAPPMSIYGTLMDECHNNKVAPSNLNVYIWDTNG